MLSFLYVFELQIMSTSDEVVSHLFHNMIQVTILVSQFHVFVEKIDLRQIVN